MTDLRISKVLGQEAAYTHLGSAVDKNPDRPKIEMRVVPHTVLLDLQARWAKISRYLEAGKLVEGDGKRQHNDCTGNYDKGQLDAGSLVDAAGA